MLAVGLMSGTSLDGIDAALIETDGDAYVRPIAFHGHTYDRDTRNQIGLAKQAALEMENPGDNMRIKTAEHLVTRLHVDAVEELLRTAKVDPKAIGVIGFHGQTIAHRPDRGWTWQIGDGAGLSEKTGISVVSDFRSADVRAGGQGAPLLPVYHRALSAEIEKPIAVLNLGGVGNITWLGSTPDSLIAFDTGPANGLIDSWIENCTGKAFDEDGRIAASGRVDQGVLSRLLDNPWFSIKPPKSLDRHDFTDREVIGLSAADGAATLTAFTAETVALALRHLPEAPRRLIVAGGGRHNPTLMKIIATATKIAAEPIEALGWNGDATEAEGFAYMAVRVLKGEPISFPGTTGVAKPMTGGVVHRP